MYKGIIIPVENQMPAHNSLSSLDNTEKKVTLNRGNDSMDYSQPVDQMFLTPSFVFYVKSIETNENFSSDPGTKF